MHISGVITVPFHIGDFLSGTMHMDTLEKGAYIMLLLSHYQSGEKGLPNDDKKLSRIAGVSPKVWDRIRPILSEKFTIENDVWVSQKCVEVLRKVHEKSSKQRAKALKRYNSDDAVEKPRQCQPKPKPYILSKDNILRPTDVSQSVWDDWVKLRKKKKAIISDNVIQGITEKAGSIGWSLEQAMETMVERNWQGFDPDWVIKKKGKEDAMFNAWKDA